jgi:hypothetical protein
MQDDRPPVADLGTTPLSRRCDHSTHQATPNPPTTHPATHPASQPSRVRPIVVELFTSEGCSSCPPADELLRTLAAAQPIPGIQIVPLAHHVDYWNDLGWRDPFATHAATTLQHAYAKRMKLKSIYTPQAIVDGRWEFVGSNERQLRTTLAAALIRQQPPLTLTASLTTGSCHVTLALPPDLKGILELHLTEANLTTRVRRGENAGRTLHHAPLVRKTLTFPNPISAVDIPLDPGWTPEHLTVAALLRDPDTAQILTSAATRPTSRPPPTPP